MSTLAEVILRVNYVEGELERLIREEDSTENPEGLRFRDPPDNSGI